MNAKLEEHDLIEKTESLLKMSDFYYVNVCVHTIGDKKSLKTKIFKTVCI